MMINDMNANIIGWRTLSWHYLHYLDYSNISFGFLLQPSPHIEMLKQIYSLDKVYYLHQRNRHNHL